MFSLLITVHILLCAALIGLVLKQQGKGADMGATFGGGANTLFGAGGATDTLTKVTTGLAVAFMVTSILLVNVYSSRQLSAGDTGTNALAGSVMAGEVNKQEPVANEESAPIAEEATAEKNKAVPSALPPAANNQPTEVDTNAKKQ